MFATLAECKTSRLREVAAACPNSAEFASLVNDACERLINRGDWPGLVQPIQVCSYAGCVTFPRYVGQVRKLNVCKQPIQIKNFWWQFFDDADRHLWPTFCGPECTMTATTRVPVLQDIMGDGRQLRAYPQVKADVGKTITIFGVDNSGQVMRTKDATTNTWTDGFTIRLLTPFGTSLRLPRHIDRILLQDGMQGNVYLYAHDTALNVDEFVATYEPGDTNPSFERYNLRIPTCTTGVGSCGQPKPLVALVKLRFIRAVRDTDLVLIDNMPALKLMIQAVKAGEAGNPIGSIQFEKLAIREMNLQMQNQLPDDQIPIDLGETGGTLIGVQQCF